MTDFERVITPAREILIPHAVSGFGRPYMELFKSAVASGFEVFSAYSHNNFDNPFRQADESLNDKMGYWAEIFHDKVTGRARKKEEQTYGRLPLLYIANAETEHEQRIEVLAPENGYWVPTDDGIFVPGTLIPFEVVSDMDKAITRLEAKGIPKEQVSHFWRLNNYDGIEMFVCRDFDPDWVAGGRFAVSAGRLPGLAGRGRVGSRSAYRIVMEASSLEEARVR